MAKGRVILSQDRINLTLERLAHQLIETYSNFQDTCIIGIQPRGIILAERIIEKLYAIPEINQLEFGKLDITFFRDDFRTREKPLVANETELDFLVENKNVILVDDVLYTGRTIHAAMTALQHYGRPKQVELLTLIDRRFNRHLPIRADYVGLTVDAIDEAFVKVEWKEEAKKDQVLLYTEKRELK